MSLTPLPIDAVLPDLVAALRANDCAVLRAPTGAGKTTRVPPALLDAELSKGKQVVMLEPRRLAARAAARRIAEERAVEVGGEVGYHVRFERKHSDRTKILVVTEGLLVRMLQDDPFLERAGVVVFDEFHERNLDTDLALALVRKVQSQARPDLKIVVMSATIATAEIARWLDDAPVIESEGRAHPVETSYLPGDDARPLHQIVAAGIARAFDATLGDVLAFLPGVGEIRRTREELEALAKKKGAELHELYGDMPSDLQDAALRRSRRRRIVLATNVAETSVTIDGVTAVVDSGLARFLRYDAGVGLDRLELDRIARDSADQRAGRAGRTMPGICLRMWTEREQHSLREREEPEIRRVDLAGAALQLLCFGERDLESFAWFEAPSKSSLAQALSLLAELGAIENGHPTDLGRTLARIPAHPRIARLLVEGHRLGVAKHAALAGAMLAERDPFIRELPGVGGARRHAALKSMHQSESDVYERVLALEKFERSGMSSTPVGELNVGAARFVLRARDALLAAVERACGGASDEDEIDPEPAPSNEDASRRAHGPRPTSGQRAALSPARSSSGATSRGIPASGQANLFRGQRTIAADVQATPGELVLGRTVRSDERPLQRALLAAYPDRVARRRSDQTRRRGVMVGGRGVRLVDESVVSDAELFVCVDLDAGKRVERAEAIVRLASAIAREWLAPSRVKTAVEIDFDEKRECVTATRRTTYDDLVLEEAQIVLPKDEQVSALLVKAAREHIDRVMPSRDEELDAFLRRLRWLREWMPELELPAFDVAELAAFIPELCAGRRSLEELRKTQWIEFLKSKLSHKQRTALDKEAPERIPVPSGSKIKIDYTPGKAPVLAARIQELFGLAESPRVAAGRTKVLMHLLAPSGRPQQVTDDLKSFWNGAYAQVRKDLRARYPRHAWPEDPWNAPAERRPRRKT
jgi:ATP-dependent helicase HrpB